MWMWYWSTIINKKTSSVSVNPRNIFNGRFLVFIECASSVYLSLYINFSVDIHDNTFHKR